jgi:hypothetical protein
MRIRFGGMVRDMVAPVHRRRAALPPRELLAHDCPPGSAGSSVQRPAQLP